LVLEVERVDNILVEKGQLVTIALMSKELIAQEVEKEVVSIALAILEVRMFIAVELQVEALMIFIAVELFEATFVIPRLQEREMERTLMVEELIAMKEEIEDIQLVEVEVSMGLETLWVEDLTMTVHRLRSYLTSLLLEVA